MFADPQSVTYATVAKSLPAISRGETQSVYRGDDSGVTFTFTLGHQFKARNRVFARLQRDAYASDPLTPANSVLASMTCTLTMDFPKVGVLASDVQALAKALHDWATDANLLKMVNGET